MKHIKNLVLTLFFFIGLVITVPTVFLLNNRDINTDLDVEIAELLVNLRETVTVDINSFQFELEIARTQDQHSQGLMRRTSLKSNEGMLFVFPDSQIRTFWMKDTYIPLDIIFLDEKLKVINFFENASPRDEKTLYKSTMPSKYVIELLGGSSTKINLTIGTTVKILSTK